LKGAPVRRFVATLSTVLALSGCAGQVRTVTYGFPQTTSTARLYLQDAAAHGPVLLDVRDNPFREDVATPFALAASNSVIGIPVRFTTDPAQAARPEFRVVVQFNPGPVGAGEACGPTRPRGSGPAAGELTALVAFCHQFQPVLALHAAAPPTDRADSPAIRELAQQSMLRMFAPEADDRNDRDPFGRTNRLRPAR
jgi:hypothetical protein